MVRPPPVLNDPAGPRPDSIRFGAAGASGIERAEVYISAHGFAPHRHDTYGIGITTAGVQTFRYRGAHHVCLPGQLHILHPDETHDGAAGTSEGFGYRILYLAPDMIRRALRDRPLPFVASPVQDMTPVTRFLASALDDIDEPVSELAQAEMTASAADALRVLSGQPEHTTTVIDLRTAELVREYLTAHARGQVSAAKLEEITGTDRYTIARHFRRAFGTSPDRYRTIRRLATARTAIEGGTALAQAAADAGFADQSHMTRHFKRTYGLTPACWAGAVARGRR